MKMRNTSSPLQIAGAVLFGVILTAGALEAQWLGAGAGGAGTDFNATTNWTGGTINGAFTNNTTSSTILLSGNQTLGVGPAFFNSSTPSQPVVTTIDGTAGGALEVLTLGGNVTLNRRAALSPAITGNWVSGSSTINVSSAAGLVVGQVISGGNGIVPGSVITAISGTNVTLSSPTYGAQASSIGLNVGAGVIFGSNMGLNLGGASRTFQNGGSGVDGAITVNSLISGANSVFIGSGVLVLNNSNNSFTGTINSGGGGLINFTSVGALGAGTNISMNNSTLAYIGSSAISLSRPLFAVNTGTFNNNSSGGSASPITLNGDISVGSPGWGLVLGGANKTATNVINGAITNGGTFTVGSGISGDFTGAIWRVASTNNSYTNTTTVQMGTLEFVTIGNVGAGNSSLGAPVNAAAGTITIGSSGNGTLRYLGAGNSSDRQLVIADSGSANAITLDASGTGAWQMTSGISYSGSAQAQLDRPLFLDGSNTNANSIGNITFNYSRASGANGNGSVTKNGAGLWVLSGSNSYNLGGGGTAGTYTTTVNNGTLRLGNANALPGGIGAAGGTSFLNINGGVLELGAGNFSRGLGSTASTVNLQQGGFSASGANRIVNLGGASAGVTWGAGNFMTSAGAFQLSSAVSDATVEFQNSINLGSSGTNTRTIQVNNGSASVDAIISGAITSSGGTQSLTKTGGGALTLSGANTYNGATTVSAGTLRLDATGASAAGGTASVAVSSGATLLVAQSNQVNDSAAVTLSGGTIQRGSGVTEVFGDLNLTTASFLDYGTGSVGTLRFGTYTPTVLLTVSNFAIGNKLQFSNTISSGDLSTLFSFSSAYTTGTEGGFFTITAVPEPSSVAAALGLLGLLGWPAARRLGAKLRRE